MRTIAASSASSARHGRIVSYRFALAAPSALASLAYRACPWRFNKSLNTVDEAAVSRKTIC
eukprot:7976682-Pyramimonas_sp.AAC.1